MRDLDTINRQQNYCSTMRINLGGHINGVKTWCAPGWAPSRGWKPTLSWGRVRPLTGRSSTGRLPAVLVLRGGLSWLSFGPAVSEARLRARRDVCRRMLDAYPRGRFSSTMMPGPIAGRQSRLALEWIRQGHFPLDDY